MDTTLQQLLATLYAQDRELTALRAQVAELQERLEKSATKEGK